MFTSPSFNILVPAYFFLTFFIAYFLSFLSLPLRYIDILDKVIYIYIYMDMAVVSVSEVNSHDSFEVKNPAKLDSDATEESVDSILVIPHVLLEYASVLKQKIIKRTLLFSQWRLVCRFPGPACRGNHTCAC
jgi:hypothetical protein